MRASMALFLALVFVFVFASSSAAEPPELDPAVATRKAEQCFAWLKADQIGSLRALFTAEMTAAIPEGKLKGTWIGLEGRFGELKDSGPTTIFQRGNGLVAVKIPLRFPLMALDLFLVFNPEGQLAGLRINPSVGGYGKRPQTPKAPFPYASEDVVFTNPKDGGQFAGSLTFPKGTGPYPTALLITGSGSQDRDETIFDHKPFLVIADHLTRNGFAVLRVDDRGAGKTTATTAGATVELHATDARAAIAFLKTRKEVDPRKIGVIGHSEGGIIASLVAAGNADVAFVVSLAGTGIRGAELMPLQVAAGLKAAEPVTQEVLAAVMAQQAKLMQLIVEGANETTLRAALADALRQGAKLVKGITLTDEEVKAGVEQQIKALTSPWYVSFVRLDPASYWARVTCPILALNGTLDTQVPADVNLAAIAAAAQKGGNKHLTTRALKGLNHLFQNAKTGALDEYATLEETFDPAVLTLMSDWLKTL